MQSILLIDDDPLVLKSLTTLLRRNNFGVTACQSGYDAISAFKKFKFDLIICDIRMADQDGIQTITKIRQLESSNRFPVPIIMVTGFAKIDAPIEAIKIGVQDYFLKPFDNVALLKSIQKNLEDYSKRKEINAPMTKKPVRFNVLSVGVLGPFGMCLEDLWGYINSCKPNFELIDVEGSVLPCMRVRGLYPERYFNEKQLHNLDRNSIFIATAAKFSIESAEIKISKIGSDKVGVSIGTSISIATAMSDFDESVLRDGNRRSKIGIFPNTVMCAPASRVSIFEHITGSNTTISTGMNSGIDAIGYACLSLENDLAELVVAGGSDALSEKILAGYRRENLLFNSDVTIGRNKRGAFLPSEGACVLVLKRADEERVDPRVYCEILSYTSGFAPFKRRQIEQRSYILKSIADECLNKANLEPELIDCFLISSYFDEFNLQTELKAIEALLNGTLSKKPVLAPKKMLGESFAAYSPTLLAFSIGLFNGEISMEAIKYLDQNNSEINHTQIRTALIVHVSPSGHESVMILKSSTS